MSILAELARKKIAIVGLGTNNQKLADFLHSQGIKFEVIENWKQPDDLIEKLEGFEVIFRTPSLPYLSSAIQQAKTSGIVVSSQTKLFFSLCPCPIIGVTGTKGKGTTSSLIAKILEAAGKKVWLAGNIGRDPFEFLPELKPDDFVVLELSSFQLQDLEYSPHIAVVLSITPDHLNHHLDFEEYIRAKSNIIAHQTEQDFAVLHTSLPTWFQGLGKAVKVYIDPRRVSGYERKLLGDHNLENIAAASSVAKILHISEDIIQSTVAAFEPLPHRLQVIGEKNGITYVDDSISTNVESTVAAIKSFSNPVIVIVGGSSKGLDYTSLGQEIKQASNVKAVIVIGEESGKITSSLEGSEKKVFTGAKNMSEIFDQIKSVAVSGDTVLLSPAAASFDMFRDYKDRGEQFASGVAKL
jgi:UDP-N-acetylmuramoylalanine--D-glutamate ligase